ncbi:conserved hypothetical protein [Ureaplasma urealyticum serovar 2 str. ATCC 27814]|uniref:hypothetical protein n=1 Tax=Ureaplasma urealyticum TaxID=2130 RepID=UPI0001794155|nr:hypothetical protein [Ureaplasma urealyticum]EEH02003.1 conserved hypothetical protein [Ureaplasma urealyticum serovar 2 str. ATCC 27814]
MIKKHEAQVEIKLLNVPNTNAFNLENVDVQIELTNKKTNKIFKFQPLKDRFNWFDSNQNKKTIIKIVGQFKAGALNQLDDDEYFISKLIINDKNSEINEKVYKPSGLQLDVSIDNQKPTHLLIPTTFSLLTSANIVDAQIISDDGVPKQLKLKYDGFVNEYNFKENELIANIELISTKTKQSISLPSVKFDVNNKEIIFDVVNNKQLQDLILSDPVFKIKSLTINNDLQVLKENIKQKELDLANKHILKIKKFTYDDSNIQNRLMKFELDSTAPIVKNVQSTIGIPIDINYIFDKNFVFNSLNTNTLMMLILVMLFHNYV